MVKTDCQWRELPHDFLRRSLRVALKKNEDASVGIADSQSVKNAEKKGSLAMTGERKSCKLGLQWLIFNSTLDSFFLCEIGRIPYRTTNHCSRL